MRRLWSLWICLALGAWAPAALANVVKTDIVADNGVIHVIDAVIMPKM